MQTEKVEETSFTRESFYEMVWATPATKLAKELGCSDVMIAKVCKAYDIPKPYLGYWAKLEHGKDPRKVPLPENDKPGLQKLTFCRKPDNELISVEPEVIYDPDIQQMLDLARRLKPVQVKSKPVSLHPLVAATRDRLRAQLRPYHKWSREQKDDKRQVMDVSADEASISRAACIMDALIKRIEKIGGSIEFKADPYYTNIKHMGVSFGQDDHQRIRLREKQNQVRIPPEKRERWGSATELKPSGILIFDTGYCDSSCVLLKDTPKRRRIEDGLNDLIIDLIKSAGKRRIKKREEDEARRKWQEEEAVRKAEEAERQKQRDELRQRQEAEQARVDDLVHQADCWRNSQNIRQYLAAAKEMLAAKHGAVPEEGEAADYLQWAYQQADRLDPLAQSPPSILDESI